MKEKNYLHTYDENGIITCCSLEEKIDRETPLLIETEKEHDHEGGGHEHSQDHSHDGGLRSKAYLSPSLVWFYYFQDWQSSIYWKPPF